MNKDKVIWVFVLALVFVTGLLWSDFSSTRVQMKAIGASVDATPTPDLSDSRDLTKYGFVQYDDPANTAPTEERRIKNQRYDNQGWVFRTVSPPAGGIGKITHNPISPAFPVEESSLIVAGEVAAANTFLSNDLRGVYTEFTIKPDEILKDSDKIGSKTIIADREGGVVVYPNGLRFMYQNSTLALPKLGGKYLFFLSRNGDSPNYEICSAYDIGGEKVYRLERAEAFDESKQLVKSQFLEIVRSKVSQRK